MARALISSLHGGIEIAFLIALLSACLAGGGKKRPARHLGLGAAVGLMAGLALAYGVVSGLDREAVELAVNGLAMGATTGLVAWLGWTSRAGDRKTNGEAGRLRSYLLLLGSAVLLVPPALDVALTQARVVSGLVRPSSVELAGVVGAALLVLAFAGFAGAVLHKLAVRVRPGLLSVVTIAVLLVLLVRDATTVVQISLVMGIVPLNEWLFKAIVFLLNNFVAFFYAFLLVAAAPLLIILPRRHRYAADGLNPAQRRKTIAAARRTATLLAAFGFLFMMVVASDGAVAFVAAHPPQLSQATPVGAENGRVGIPFESVADGQLHRFAFTTGGGVVVRFLVVHKGSGVYGVGLDACEFCGVAGYRQEKENVICAKCNAAINRTTIGFPGGCNPIPLPGGSEGAMLTIAVEDLEGAEGVFAR